MLRLTSVSLARGARVLYRDATALASPGERVGLVGANGCGKSTLLSAVLGAMQTESGNIERPTPDRIAHVAQDIEDVDQDAISYVLEGHAPLAQATQALLEAEAGDDDMALAHAHFAVAELNPGAIRAQALTVMHGLGFSDEAAQQPMRRFSGGWRNRLALARALLRPADLLLLDEPTNHLDLDSVIWLEAWLRRQPATVIIISHDREFLDRCVDTIWHIEGATPTSTGTLVRYAGNYSKFELARIERQRQQDAQARSYQRTSAHLQSFVDRFRAQATKARQAQSRLKMLQRLVEVEPSRAEHEWRFTFPEPQRTPDRLMDAEGMCLGYGDTRILNQVRMLIQSGDRIGVLGVNGAGKSTLIKAITGDLQPQTGVIHRAQGLVIGYFAQHQIEQLDLEASPLLLLRRMAPNAGEQELRNFLGGFRFSGDMASTPVRTMSGGEKARCALAMIAWQKPNLLVLDEPTNHLDMETREALTMALSSFEGALLLVSHDRHLLRATTDVLWLVHDGVLTDFDGDLDQYTEFVLSNRREKNATGPKVTAEVSKETRRKQTQERDRLAKEKKPLETRLRQLERDLQSWSDKVKQLDAQLADPAFYNGDQNLVQTSLRDRNNAAERVGSIEADWLACQEQLDVVVAGIQAADQILAQG